MHVPYMLRAMCSASGPTWQCTWKRGPTEAAEGGSGQSPLQLPILRWDRGAVRVVGGIRLGVPPPRAR